MSVDPSQGLQNALNEANNDIKNINQEYANLRLSVAIMMDMLKKAAHDPMEAFQAMQMAQNTIMPEMMQVQGVKVVQVSDGLNIASALRAFNTYLQQFFNKGAKITPQEAAQFANGLNELYSFLHFANFKSSLAKFLDQGSYDSLCSALSSIIGAFGGSGGNVNGNQVMDAMQKWFNNTASSCPFQGFYQSMSVAWYEWWNGPNNPHRDPNGFFPMVPSAEFEQQYLKEYPSMSPPTAPGPPNPEIAVIQGACQQISTTVSSISQTQQTLIQYDSNLYNQLVGIQQKVLDSSKTLGMAMVQNQKAG